MADFGYQMPKEFLMKISQLGEDIDIIAPKVLEEGAKVVESRVRANLEAAIGSGTKYPSKSTGELLSALGSTPAMRDRNGNYNIKVGFNEPRSDGGVNEKIANVLEFGRSGQPPKPFLKPGRKAAEKTCIAVMGKALEEEIKKL